MATAPQGTTAKDVGKGRTFIAVSILVVMVLVILLLACRFNKGPRDAREIRSLQYSMSVRKPQRKGISLETVQAMPVVRYGIMASTSKRNAGEHSQSRGQKALRENLTDECVICKETFLESDEVRVLPCEHIYHRYCVDRWLLGVSGTCPECRATIDDFVKTSAVDIEAPKPVHC